MTPELTADQRQALHDAHDTGPVEVVDPTTQTSYVLLRTDVYERCRAMFDEEFDVREAYAAMDEVAGEEGWNDPAMDVYNSLDPRRTP